MQAAAVDSGALPSEQWTPWKAFQPMQRHWYLTLLFLTATSNYFDFFILSILLDPIKREFHLSDAMLGMLGGVGFALSYSIAGLPIARRADRGDRPKVIAVCLFGWSVMTAACGLATSFWQLMLARLGVGAFEPGAIPAAQSIVVDIYPPTQRAMALGLLSMGASAVGYLCGITLGGRIAAAFGWRWAFMAAAIPGIVLAALIRLCVPEPRRGPSFGRPRPSESFAASLRMLMRKRAFGFVLAGICISTIFTSAVSLFLPSFMLRSLHANERQINTTWGISVAAADLVGALLGGWLAGVLGKRDIRWYAWLPALSSALAVPLYWLALSAAGFSQFLVGNTMAEIVLSIAPPAVFCAMHEVCGGSRRATAIAVWQFSNMAIGYGLGPLITGIVSDALDVRFGRDGLRYSLAVMVMFLVPAVLAYQFGGKHLAREVEA